MNYVNSYGKKNYDSSWFKDTSSMQMFLHTTGKHSSIILMKDLTVLQYQNNWLQDITGSWSIKQAGNLTSY